MIAQLNPVLPVRPPGMQWLLHLVLEDGGGHSLWIIQVSHRSLLTGLQVISTKFGVENASMPVFYQRLAETKLKLELVCCPQFAIDRLSRMLVRI